MENLIVAPMQSEFETILEQNNLENTTDAPNVRLSTAQGKNESQSLNKLSKMDKSLKEKSRLKTNTKQGSGLKVSSGKVPEINRRKIRERIIHLLALKPFKKLELYARLQKEGLRKAEQSVIGNILREIAQLRQNVYSLKNYMWRDVNENWPYYTEQEQQQLKLDKAQNVMNMSTADEVSLISNVSLSSTTSVNRPCEILNKKGFKRTSLDNEEPQVAKKRRISSAPVRNDKNKGPLNSGNVLTQHVTNTTAPKQKENISKRKTTVKTTKRGKKSQNKNVVLQTTFDDTQQKIRNHESVLPTISDIADSDTHQKNQYQERFFPTTSEESDSDTYKKNQHLERFLPATSTKYEGCYTTITSIEQRRQYKADFEEDYEEYFPLLQRVEEVRYIFRELPEQLQQVPEGSAEYEHIKDRIFKEYEILNSEKEIQLKQRFDYLEAKLLYIKQLVDDFDEKLLREKAVQAAMAMAKEYLLEQQQVGQFDDF
ncbi:RNA polymerase II elongation factor Ell-like [Zeugodacus cucurbitae]|uniref:RNA polymerase II elongation factor Ell-like n=1 Tax=Zeugodacus cucurbitae TaxID=28588 RepID=UPI0023D9327A|nr:RNA polymerase II elongation factor Ell-like [Zeugodacus cucurbitae]